MDDDIDGVPNEGANESNRQPAEQEAPDLAKPLILALRWAIARWSRRRRQRLAAGPRQLRARRNRLVGGR